MKLPSNITTFSIISARYNIGDQTGAQAVLAINYADNSYRLLGNLDSDSTLEKAASAVASDLLARKHGVNFAQNQN